MAYKSWIRWATLLFIPRIPFFNAIILLLMVAEKADINKHVTFDTKAVYIQVGMAFVCGVLMSIDKFRKEAALVYCGQIGYFLVTTYNNAGLRYNDSLKMRMIIKECGVIGICLLYAHIMSTKKGSGQLRKAGEAVLGAYAICYTYALLNSPEDKLAFVQLLPGGQMTLFIAASFMGGIGMCYLSSYFVKDISIVLAVVLSVVTAFNDMNFRYWTKRRGVDFWLHARLACDNVCVIVGLVMVWSVFKSRLKVSEKEVREKTY